MKANGTRWGWQNPRFVTSGLQIRWDGDGIDNYIIGAYTYMGFNYELDCYNYIYGLNEVTVTDQSWAMQECRRLGEQNCGGLSAEYSGGEVNVPTIRAGGGGGGIFWNGGYNTPAEGDGLSSSILTFPISAVSTLLGASASDYLNNKESLTDLGKSLTKAQKAKLAAKYPTKLSKGASAAKYGKAVARELEKTGKTLGYIGLGIEALDVLLSGEIHASNIYNGVIGAVCIFSGPVGWIIGGVALTGDIISCAYTGRTIGGNIDRLFDDKSCRLWDGVY